MADPAASTPLAAKLQTAIDDSSLWLLFAVIGGSGASMLALGLLLRSKEQLTSRVIIGTVLHSAAWGAAVFMMGWSSMQTDLAFLLGLSIFSGMGVASFLDVILLLVKQRLGIQVTINPPKP